MDFAARESQRIDSENFVSYNMFDDQGRITLSGIATTIDISRTGMALKSKDEMIPGAKIELTIGVGDDIVKVNGLIRNQSSIADTPAFAIGIEFDFVSHEALDKLALIYPDILK